MNPAMSPTAQQTPDPEPDVRTLKVTMTERPDGDPHQDLHPLVKVENDGVNLNDLGATIFQFQNETEKPVRCFLCWQDSQHPHDVHYADVEIPENGNANYPIVHAKVYARGGQLRRVYIGTLYEERIGTLDPARQPQDFFRLHPFPMFPPDETQGAHRGMARMHDMRMPMMHDMGMEMRQSDYAQDRMTDAELRGGHHTKDALIGGHH
jgi:hypothetical protein